MHHILGLIREIPCVQLKPFNLREEKCVAKTRFLDMRKLTHIGWAQCKDTSTAKLYWALICTTKSKNIFVA